MDQTLITVLRYSITYYQKDLFICAQYANKHKATALHKAYWLPCYLFLSIIQECNQTFNFFFKKAFRNLKLTFHILNSKKSYFRPWNISTGNFLRKRVHKCGGGGSGSIRH